MLNKQNCHKCQREILSIALLKKPLCLACKEQKKLRKKELANEFGTRNESKFQTELGKSVESYNKKHESEYEWRLFMDDSIQRYSYDCEIIGFFRSISCIELKEVKHNEGYIDFKKLFYGKRYQIEKLLKRENQGFCSYVIVNYYSKRDKINKAYVFRPMIAAKFDRIQLKDVPRYAFELDWLGSGIWDIGPILP